MKPPRDHEVGRDRDMERVYGMAELLVAKQRHGATGSVRMRFDSKITKFSDPIDDERLPQQFN